MVDIFESGLGCQNTLRGSLPYSFIIIIIIFDLYLGLIIRGPELVSEVSDLYMGSCTFIGLTVGATDKGVQIMRNVEP